MNTMTKATMSHTNHCRRLTFIAIVPPRAVGAARLPPREDSTRMEDRGSTCTSVHKYLREYPYPQKWHNTGRMEPHSETVSTLAPAGKIPDQRPRPASSAVSEASAGRAPESGITSAPPGDVAWAPERNSSPWACGT